MFFPEGQLRVYLYGQPADLRRSFDGLQALVRQGLGEDPLDGGLYVFINRRGTQIRVLYFDRSGFCLWAKRLEAGRFVSNWRAVRTRQMDWTGLKLLLEGIEPARQRKRFRLASQSISACGFENTRMPFPSSSRCRASCRCVRTAYPHAICPSGGHPSST